MEVTVFQTGVAGVSAAAAVTAYKLLRPYFPATVNCWFCSANTKVKYEDRNSWTCPSCDQYNGFTSDGGYNKELQEQHLDDSFDVASVRYAQPLPSSGENESQVETSNGLCQTCNLNQELKILQLKNFSPSQPEKFDEEIQEYRSHLERTYRLCRYCEATLHQKLGEQDSWIKPKLLSWKLKQNRQTSLSSAIRLLNQADDDNLQRRTTLFVAFSFLAAVILNHYTHYKDWLPPSHSLSNMFYLHYITAALLLVLTVYCLNPWSLLHNKRHQVSLTIWVLTFCHASIEDLIISSLNKIFYVSPPEKLQFFARCSVAIICLASSAFWSPVVRRQKSKPSNNFDSCKMSQQSILEEESEETLTQDQVSTITPSSSTTAKTHRPVISPPQIGDCLPYHEVRHGSFNSTNDDSSYDISLLHIDKSKTSYSSSRRSQPFEVRSYKPVDTMSFFENKTKNRNILRPATFVYDSQHRVAQSSWVAGGYWQRENGSVGLCDQHDHFSSRSSSQTSGFVSEAAVGLDGLMAFDQNASLPNSRVNSICGDRHSILSEPLFHSKTFTQQRQQNVFMRSNKARTVDLSDDEEYNRVEYSFHKKKPKAESSPILAGSIESSFSKSIPKNSLLDRKFQITISLHTLLLAVSLSLNVGIVWYLILYNS